MFLFMSVIPFTGDPHVTITHDALDLNIKGPWPWPWLLSGDGTSLYRILLSKPHSSPDLGPPCTGNPMLMTSDAQYWRSAQTCSLEPPSPQVLASGGCTHPTGMLSCLGLKIVSHEKNI